MYSNNHNPKFIYIDIPKTASTSLRTIIKPCIKSGSRNKHQTIREHSGLDLDIYFKFAVSRNPWDRMVSFYHWGQQIAPQNLDKERAFNSFKTFDEFVDYFYHNSINLLKFDDDTTVNNRRFWPMYEWIVDKDGKPRMDYILKFENLEEDCLELVKLLNLRQKLPFIKKSKHEPYKVYYNSYTVNKVKKIYEKDVEFFRYRYGATI